MGKLDQKSSVGEFNVLQDCIDAQQQEAGGTVGTEYIGSNSSATEPMRGAALRELERFLSQYDEKCYFSNLSRVLTGDGSCCWCSKDNAEKMKKEAECDDSGDNALPGISSATLKPRHSAEAVRDPPIIISSGVAVKNASHASHAVALDRVDDNKNNPSPIYFSNTQTNSMIRLNFNMEFSMDSGSSWELLDGKTEGGKSLHQMETTLGQRATTCTTPSLVDEGGSGTISSTEGAKKTKTISVSNASALPSANDNSGFVGRIRGLLG